MRYTIIGLDLVKRVFAEKRSQSLNPNLTELSSSATDKDVLRSWVVTIKPFTLRPEQ